MLEFWRGCRFLPALLVAKIPGIQPFYWLHFCSAAVQHFLSKATVIKGFPSLFSVLKTSEAWWITQPQLTCSDRNLVLPQRCWRHVFSATEAWTPWQSCQTNSASTFWISSTSAFSPGSSSSGLAGSSWFSDSTAVQDWGQRELRWQFPLIADKTCHILPSSDAAEEKFLSKHGTRNHLWSFMPNKQTTTKLLR